MLLETGNDLEELLLRFWFQVFFLVSMRQSLSNINRVKTDDPRFWQEEMLNEGEIFEL